MLDSNEEAMGRCGSVDVFIGLTERHLKHSSIYLLVYINASSYLLQTLQGLWIGRGGRSLWVRSA